MKTLNFAIGPGSPSWSFNNLVRSIRYESGDAGVNDNVLLITDVTGNMINAEMRPGDLIKLPELAQGIQVLSPGNFSVTGKITVGAGDITSNRSVGQFTVNGSVGITGPVEVRPELATASWASTATFAANTAVTIFTPAANVNGAIILAAYANDAASTNPNIALIARSSAPASITDSDVLCQSLTDGFNTGSNVSANLRLQEPVRIASGLGLYIISSVAGTAGMLKSARWRML